MGLTANLAAFVRSLTSAGKVPASALENVPSSVPTTVIITASGNWTCPAGVTKAKITVMGAGGTGAASGSGGAGSGGGAGGEAQKTFTNLVPGTDYAVVIGTAASASSTFTGPGSVVVTGGGGAIGSTVGAVPAGGAGGTATGGDINIVGEPGDGGHYTASGAHAGKGGNTSLGRGGKPGSVISGQAAGAAATGYGAGGGGSAAVGGSNTAGGAHAPGVVIIEY